MTYHGRVQGGLVVADDPSALPEGAEVEIRVIVASPGREGVPRGAAGAALLKLAGIVDTLPDDMAVNHDHYLHGSPKRDS